MWQHHRVGCKVGEYPVVSSWSGSLKIAPNSCPIFPSVEKMWWRTSIAWTLQLLLVHVACFDIYCRKMYKCTRCAFMRKTSIEVGIHVVHEHFPPEKVPFMCVLCNVQKLSLKSAKKHKREKHPSAEMNITMMFMETKERVEFTSEHVYKVPKEPDSNQKDANQSTHEPEQPQEVNQANEVPQWQQKRKASPEAEEPRQTKVRWVLSFDSPSASPASEIGLQPTPRDPFKKGTISGNTEDPCLSPPDSLVSLSPTQ